MKDLAPMRRLAALLGCTEGQAYTLVIAIVVTVIAIWLGIPPTLRERTPGPPAPTSSITEVVPVATPSP